jgi:hypothetical protein
MERELYAPFGQWISKNWANRPQAVFELKRTKAPRFNKNLVETHQIRSLKMATYPTGAYWKIADEGFSQKLWDCQIIKNSKAYLVICFDRDAYFIDIHKWCDFVEDRVSVTELECKALCDLKAEL